MKKSEQDMRLVEIRDTIVHFYKPEKIILFGSRAIGTPQQESDYDIFVVKKTKKHPIDRIREVSKLFSRRNFGLDVIVRTPSEVQRRIRMGDFFYQEIFSKGRILYEK